MTRQEKQTDYQAIYPRYQQASRQEKSRILDEFCSVCGYQTQVCDPQVGAPIGVPPFRQKARTGFPLSAA